MLAQRRASMGNSHMDTSIPLPYRFSPYMDQLYGPLPPGPPPGVPGFTSIDGRGKYFLKLTNF